MIVPTKWHHNPSTQRQSLAYPSTQRWSSAYLSTQGQSLACPLGEVSDVLYGGSWSCQAGAPKGHLPHRGGDSIHIHHPCGFVLHNVAGTHHGHSRLTCHFQLQGFWGCLVSGHQQWVSPQTGHHFPEAQRWCHFLCGFQRPSWQCGLRLCIFILQMFLCPSMSSPPSPRTLPVRPPFQLSGNWRGLSSGFNWTGRM